MSLNHLFGKLSRGICAAICLLLATHVHAVIRPPIVPIAPIAGHVPAVVPGLKSVGRLPQTNHLHLVIGLPLRNPSTLEGLMTELHDPGSPNYRQWLTPGQFTEKFGPTEEDYQKVLGFAKANGLKVTGQHSGRMMVEVDAPVAIVEQAFHIALHTYAHPKENRLFYAPDTNPTVDTDLPILHISGLDNYIVPHRLGESLKPITASTTSTNSTSGGITPYATSIINGNFIGKDFRNAYVPGVTNTGAGQYIAIVDVGGPYWPLDVYMYETNAGYSTNIVITNILCSGGTGIPASTNVDEGEQVLDIDMALSMAPDAVILNYEGEAHAVFGRIASDNLAKQMTLSYGFGIDSTILQIFQQFLAQGQALCQASGDGGGDPNGGTGLTGSPYATIVGGSHLSMSAGKWASDVVWGGSGGGISGYGIPNWQLGVATIANQGSTVYRNYPDVSMPADYIFTVYKHGQLVGGTGGTSASSPLWAGFMALANQQAASLGKPAIGFPNPAIYAIGKGPSATYTRCFHDITSGNSGRYTATAGYDLSTGWGTPTGSNTIAALIGTGTNDFMFFASRDSLSFLRGTTAASASTALTVTRMNGYSGSATFTISGLPTGVSAAFSPVTTSTTSTLTLTVVSTAPAGTFTSVITATSGELVHSVNLTLTIANPIPGTTQISLASYYNRTGFYTDGRAFGTGFDGSYAAMSATLLGSWVGWNGCVFNLGPANAPDVIYCAGQTIPITGANTTTLLMLAAGVNGNQLSNKFVLTYTDNTKVTNTQSFSDWAKASYFPGESVAVAMAYRNVQQGAQETGTPVNLDGYSFNLNQAKTLKSITLPNNANIVIAAMVLANDPVTVSLASLYNRAGIYSDGTNFSNGGIDGSGYAYSAALLGGSFNWTNTSFSLGPANTLNVISCAGQVAPLPAGNFYNLRMLATGIQGNQTSQSFIVNYTDGSSSTFVQSLSDWYSPQNYAGESKAVVMGYRNSSGGGKDSRVFNLYGYSFALNSTKTVASIRMPGNGNVIVAAISLVPNWQPLFNASTFTLASIMAGNPFTGSLTTNVYDLNGGVLTYSKVSGPGWLTVQGNGVLSGTPLSADVGDNGFVVSVTDSGNLSGTATMNIAVTAAPPIVSSISRDSTNLVVQWTGGIAPYQVQVATNLSVTHWDNIGGPIGSNSFNITPDLSESYYRIMGQ